MSAGAEKIITSFDYPPIPLRCFDWSAVRDGYCGCGECHCPVGHGATEAEAIADLLEQEEDRGSDAATMVTIDDRVLCDECGGTGERECDDGPRECIFCDHGVVETLGTVDAEDIRAAAEPQA